MAQVQTLILGSHVDVPQASLTELPPPKGNKQNEYRRTGNVDTIYGSSLDFNFGMPYALGVSGRVLL